LTTQSHFDSIFEPLLWGGGKKNLENDKYSIIKERKILRRARTNSPAHNFAYDRYMEGKSNRKQSYVLDE